MNGLVRLCGIAYVHGLLKHVTQQFQRHVSCTSYIQNDMDLICFDALLYTLMMLHGSHALMLHTCLILHVLTATSTPSPGSFPQAYTLCSPPRNSLQGMANGAEVP